MIHTLSYALDGAGCIPEPVEGDVISGVGIATFSITLYILEVLVGLREDKEMLGKLTAIPPDRSTHRETPLVSIPSGLNVLSNPTVALEVRVSVPRILDVLMLPMAGIKLLLY
jgi:hypothetical protein